MILDVLDSRTLAGTLGKAKTAAQKIDALNRTIAALEAKAASLAPGSPKARSVAAKIDKARAKVTALQLQQAKATAAPPAPAPAPAPRPQAYAPAPMTPADTRAANVAVFSQIPGAKIINFPGGQAVKLPPDTLKALNTAGVQASTTLKQIMLATRGKGLPRLWPGWDRQNGTAFLADGIRAGIIDPGTGQLIPGAIPALSQAGAAAQSPQAATDALSIIDPASLPIRRDDFADDPADPADLYDPSPDFAPTTNYSGVDFDPSPEVTAYDDYEADGGYSANEYYDPFSGYGSSEGDPYAQMYGLSGLGKSIFSKIGKGLTNFAKAAIPLAAPLTASIPGFGPAIAAGLTAAFAPSSPRSIAAPRSIAPAPATAPAPAGFSLSPGMIAAGLAALVLLKQK